MTSKWPAITEHRVALESLIENFHSTVRALESARDVAGQEKPGSHHDKLLPLYYALLEDSKAIGLLASRGFLNQSYVVARAFTERLINYCYLHICDAEELERFFVFSKQKGIRQLNKSIRVGETAPSIKFSGYEDIAKQPEIAEALQSFTSKSGKELTNWTVISLNDRAARIEEFLGKKGIIGLSILAIYADASEALHGTIYGSLFHLGVYKPNSFPGNYSVESIESNTIIEFGALMVMMISQTSAIFHILHKEFDSIDIKMIDETTKKSMLGITKVIVGLERAKKRSPDGA